MQVHTHPSDDALATAAAGLISDRLAQAEGDRANLALAGGSTPIPTYRALRQLPVDWSITDVWLSDERWVPHDSDESNGRMAEETLIRHVTGATFHRPIYSPNVEPDESAAYYEAALRRVISDGRPDVVLLGMGTDGHTASLFPGSSALVEPTQRWFVENHVDSMGAWRLTATPHLLWQARAIIVIVAGEEKADVLAEVVQRPSGRYPIELLHDAEGDVLFLTDRSAASRLSNTQ